jgi:hypothetical protein
MNTSIGYIDTDIFISLRVTREMGESMRNFSENLKGRNHLGNLGVDVRTTLMGLKTIRCN